MGFQRGMSLAVVECRMCSRSSPPIITSLYELRFMQTSNQPDVTPVHVVEKLLDEDSAWIAEGFEEVHKAHDNVATASQKNLTIRYSSRKSFNGANPFIERHMQSMGKRR